MRSGPTAPAREEGGWRDEGVREVESAVLWSCVERSWDGTQRKAAESAALEVGAGIEATVTRRTVQRVIASIPFFRWTMRGNRPGWSAGPGRHVQTEGRPHQIPYLLELISLSYTIFFSLTTNSRTILFSLAFQRNEQVILFPLYQRVECHKILDFLLLIKI